MLRSYDPPGKKGKPKKVVNKPSAQPEKQEESIQPVQKQEDEQIVNTQDQDQAVNTSGRPGNVSKEDFLD